MAVFYSSLPRTDLEIKNNLHDIISKPHGFIAPTNKCVERKNSNSEEFLYRTDKVFEPKKRPKLKVKTVRDIRREYETYVYTYLKDDLEKQDRYLFKKIESGTAREDCTISTAMKMLESDQPKLRSTFFMIMKVNPLNRKYSTQYAFWNGVTVRLSGSRGGSDKFKWKYDISHNKHLKRITKYRNRKQHCLLKSSIYCDFKPGPLSKKNILDRSYQKRSIGAASSIELPKIYLEIKPEYNSTLDSSILKYIEDAPDDTGKLNKNWTNFALSALETRPMNATVIPNKNQSKLKFNLKYKNDQKHILVRHGKDNLFDQNYKIHSRIETFSTNQNDETDILNVIEELLRATEISVNQNFMYTAENLESKENDFETENTKCGKIEKLDLLSPKFSFCGNNFCSLGCVCDTLKYKHIKQHCGVPGCMFKCSCTSEKAEINNTQNLFQTDIVNDVRMGFLNSNGEKFCQLDQKNILNKSRRRKLLAPRTYTEFNNQLDLKDNLINKRIAVNVLKLNCDNIETWCMVHNLYSCFCKGILVESITEEEQSSLQNVTEDSCVFVSKFNSCNEIANTTMSEPDSGNEMANTITYIEDINLNVTCNNLKSPISFSSSLLEEKNKFGNDEPASIADSKINNTKLVCYDRSLTCARTKPYKKRKFNDDYYFVKNKKILNMETNDKNLQKKLRTYITKSAIPVRVIKKTHEDNTEPNRVCEADLNQTCETNLTLKSSEIAAELPQKLIKNKPALVTWLEAHYKRHKEKMESGAKITLEAPKPGKYALYSWETLLERYREKKNFFLISRNQPHRIFIAVNTNHKFFESCINIDEIRYTEWQNYPETVKNLLTNKTSSKDIFYILYGLPFCWELFGNVVKSKESEKKQCLDTNIESNVIVDIKNCNEHQICTSENFEETNLNKISSKVDISFVPTSSDNSQIDKIPVRNNQVASNLELQTNSIHKNNNISISENIKGPVISRWFFMTIENDFDELQFGEKGFFVKYENIIKAIEVARSKLKTVRLSGMKCMGTVNNPQFGIYALPDMEKLCVFVGPYEENESLGMETIKGRRHYTSIKKTRGYWLKTRKIDNFKVIENPFSFIPCNKSTLNQNDGIVSEDNSKTTVIQATGEYENTEQKTKQNLGSTEVGNSIGIKENLKKNKKTSLTKPSTKIVCDKLVKVIKPITIRKSNDFYRIENGFKTFSLLKNPNIKICSNKDQMLNKLSTTVSTYPSPGRSLLAKNKTKVLLKNQTESNMLVLKPEEINRRLENNLSNQVSEQKPKDDIKNYENSERIIDKTIVLKQNDSQLDDVCVLSDDEDYLHFQLEKWKDVWIEISNITNFGCFRGKKNEKGMISFQFPGFKFSEFYEEKEAFQFLYKVLSRKVFVPKSMNLEWRVVETEDKLNNKRILNAQDFAPDFIMTKIGLLTKSELSSINQGNLRNAFAELRTAVFYATDKEINAVGKLINEAEIVINQLKRANVNLEKEKNNLQQEVKRKKQKIIDTSNFMPIIMQKLVRRNLDLTDL